MSKNIYPFTNNVDKASVPSTLISLLLILRFDIREVGTDQARLCSWLPCN